jgi:hypothetical protein
VLPSYPLSPQASAAVWTGRELLVWDYELNAGAYNPEADEWKAGTDLPLRFYECYPQGALARAFVVAWHCGQAALYDIGRSQWNRIGVPRTEIFGRPVSAGNVVLFAGGSHEGHANALWAYKPKSPVRAAAAGGTPHRPFTPRTGQRGEDALMPVTLRSTGIMLAHVPRGQLSEHVEVCRAVRTSTGVLVMRQ